MRPQGRTVEGLLAAIGARAHGVVTRGELLRAGITPDEIKQRLRTGALLREHRAVYRDVVEDPQPMLAELRALLQ